MNKIFTVELSSEKCRSCKLTLPATYYRLLDALEQLRMNFGEEPKWKIVEHTDFQQLLPFLHGESLYEVNELFRRLDSMDQVQRAAFEGLFQMAQKTHEGPMSLADLFTYANSTDCCHVVGEATDDASLGRFYAVNGFVPELDNLPDSVFDKLDFAMIGSEMRAGEGGIFTKYGYVVQDADLKPVTEPVDVTPQIPDYAFRLLIGRYPFETNDQPEKQVYLELPATEERIAQALEECGAASWEEVTYETEDCAIPSQEKDMAGNDIGQFNKLAKIIKRLEASGELPKLKATLDATTYYDVSVTAAIAEDLDEYIFEPEMFSARDVAMRELRCIVSESSLSLLLPHVNLEEYGKDIIFTETVEITPYGLVERVDGGMLWAPSQEEIRSRATSDADHKQDAPQMGGMTLE